MTDSPFASSILITGGAGFLGRGILRYIQRNRIDAHVTVYSRDEQKHYSLRAMYPNVRTILGDINDIDRLTAVAAGHEVIIHAAALKHIPEAERDCGEAIKTNVDGSRAVGLAAMRAGVKTVVGISTDKVCSPRNTYGATKMLMERAFQELARLGQTRFVNVRYGNVISSTGSVVPLFQDQIRSLGRINITALEMTRFWLSIDEAVQLIEVALGTAHNGHTFVYPCKALKIMDVAQTVWDMTGHKGNVSHHIIGTRPGEKIHETLLDSYEAPHATWYRPQYRLEHIIIPPATQLHGDGINTIQAYESSFPTAWMKPEEFIALVEDAKRV